MWKARHEDVAWAWHTNRWEIFRFYKSSSYISDRPDMARIHPSSYDAIAWSQKENPHHQLPSSRGHGFQWNDCKILAVWHQSCSSEVCVLEEKSLFSTGWLVFKDGWGLLSMINSLQLKDVPSPAILQHLEYVHRKEASLTNIDVFCQRPDYKTYVTALLVLSHDKPHDPHQTKCRRPQN